MGRKEQPEIFVVFHEEIVGAGFQKMSVEEKSKFERLYEEGIELNDISFMSPVNRILLKYDCLPKIHYRIGKMATIL